MSIPSALKPIGDTFWELPVDYKEGMGVPARIVASEKLLHEMDAGVFDQISNVATLPGVVTAAGLCCHGKRCEQGKDQGAGNKNILTASS